MFQFQISHIIKVRWQDRIKRQNRKVGWPWYPIIYSDIKAILEFHVPQTKNYVWFYTQNNFVVITYWLDSLNVHINISVENLEVKIRWCRWLNGLQYVSWMRTYWVWFAAGLIWEKNFFRLFLVWVFWVVPGSDSLIVIVQVIP